MPETLIKVENVSKKFCFDLKKSLWYGFKDMGTEILGQKNPTNHSLRDKEFWAVKNVNFEVKRGECLGLIGRNGAGKSTLLKMLNGLIKPDIGRIEMHGKVGALIELGAGFNPVLTGRENIFINAAVLGFSKRETLEKLDAIIDFSEIRDFIDSPVQNYSSGMKVRLGFSIAAQLEPDILLIDEVLAVGDMGFALKCYNKMDELLGKTAMILVSHSMPQVARICTGLTVMNQGKPVFQGEGVSEGISFYYNYFEQKIGNFIGSDQAELFEISLSSQNKISSKLETFEINHGDNLNVHIKIKIFQIIIKPQIDITFYDKEQRNFGVAINFSEMLSLDEAKGILSVTASFPNVQFGRGLFSISITLKEINNKIRKNIFRAQSAIFFKVISDDLGWVPMKFTPTWQIDNIIDLPFH
jgi:lipopolysaccharide transport system ATP-binding protein